MTCTRNTENVVDGTIVGHLPAEVSLGGDEIPPGTFHGGDEIPPGTFHGGIL